MPLDQEDAKKWGCALLGGLVGAALIQHHHDEARKSQAEKDDPDGVVELCELIGDLLEDWEPPCYEREDEYTQDLFAYLDEELDDDISVELRTSTSRGIPDILIDDRLVLELKVNPNKAERDRLECAFQGSKVFERGGPYTDLYWVKDVRDAKRDSRLRESGPLSKFEFEGFSWPLEPKTAFYDWLYVTFLKSWREWAHKLYSYGGFTDIEFNPYRSINCQARSCALFLSLMKRGLLDEATKTPQDFIETLLRFDYHPQLRDEHGQTGLFGESRDGQKSQT